jgi:hypothetical protein
VRVHRCCFKASPQFLLFMWTPLIVAGMAVAQNCFALPRNTPCGPDFERYPINRPVQDFVNNLNRFTQVKLYNSGGHISTAFPATRFL